MARAEKKKVKERAREKERESERERIFLQWANINSFREHRGVFRFLASEKESRRK